jgi:tripartite-type tricarboxylate transporter receptor subunit TctC
MKLFRGLTVIAFSIGISSAALAQSWPSQPIRAFIPFGAGSATDVIPRTVFDALSKDLGQPITVENKGGAGGTLGIGEVVRAKPDGYTILANSSAQTIAPWIVPNFPYDVAKDLSGVLMIGQNANVLLVSPSKGWKTAKDLIAAAKAKPGTINYGSAGVGTTPHLTAELFKSMAGVDIVHVPYRGTGPALVDLMAGHIQLFFDLLPNSVPQIKAGKVKALGNAGPTRPASLPDLPTVAEQGLPGFSSTSWWGFVGPAKMPEAVKAKLIEGTRKVLASPDVIKHMRDLSAEPGDAFGEDFAAFLAAEEKKWGDVVRVSGAHAD